tara:strand:- start:3994 stop:4191 length:198 start_codon:yes stop_codon:yes gene_type:complete
MKTDKMAPLEKMNPQTGKFEKVYELTEDAIRILNIFDAEQRIMERIFQIQDWRYGLKGVQHIEYD